MPDLILFAAIHVSILIAQSVVERMVLVTSDEAIRKYPVATRLAE